MKQYKIIVIAILISFLFSPITNVRAQTDVPVVCAVLFYSPTCGHCEYVINEVLVPMMENYGEQLQIVAIDVTQPFGQELFLAALQTFGLDHSGVPFLVFDDMYLMGSGDIPEQFPRLVEAYLAQGGLDWPDVPGLEEAINEFQKAPAVRSTPLSVVRAVYFYRSACSHCQKLTQEVIPPIIEMYGDQLEIFGIDVSSSEGDILYDAAVERFKIQKFGVPTLILGNQVLVGGAEIEESFASILEEYFVQGGLDWPDIPGLHEAIAKTSEPDVLTPITSAQSGMLQTAPAPATVSPAFASPTATLGIPLSDNGSSSWPELFALDPAGNTLSVLVLVGMLGSLVWVVVLFKKTNGVSRKHNWIWFIPLLCAVGFGVASYLAYVETTQVEAICGPVGHCNTVQQSEYARLFGILPTGVLGMIGYTTIFVTWLLTRYASDYLSNFGYLSILAMTTTGTIFSVYLTFLEPFVIGATCAWCLTSSTLMTILMLLSVAPAKFAVKKIRASNK